jgi:hypothetical protein
LDEIDPVAAVRGSSAGFSVLVLGGLLAPVLAVKVPAIGSIALVATALIGFATAAARQGSSVRPSLQGALAAIGAYLLVLPLVQLQQRSWNIEQIGLTLVAAIVVGSVVGPISVRVGVRRAGFAARPGARR